MKVEMEFEQDYDTGGILPRHLGRFSLNDHVCRLVLTAHGRLCLIVDKSAVTDGSLILADDFDGVGVLGLKP